MFVPRVCAKTGKRREKLSGEPPAAFGRALEWQEPRNRTAKLESGLARL